MSKPGDINGWQCRGPKGLGKAEDGCGGITYCIHVDEGVTPMFLGCRAWAIVGGGEAQGHELLERCKGTGISLMYPDPPVPHHVLAMVRWEWFKPDAEELRKLERENPALAEHVHQGGLDLRLLTDAGREALSEHHGYKETES